MGPSTGRYLVVRTVTGAGAALLLALPGTGADGALGPLVIALVAASSLGAWGVVRFRPPWRRGVLAATLALDLALEAILIGSTGAPRSPFVLLFPLTIAASGLFFGFMGSMAVTLGAILAYAGVVWSVGGRWEGAPLLMGVFLLFVGLLNGLAGRRAVAQSREMHRVRVELERALLDAETIVESLETPLLCLDLHGEIRRANRAAAQLLRLGEDPEGKLILEAGERKRLEPLVDLLGESYRDGWVSCHEVLLPAANGGDPTPVEVLLSSVRDRTGEKQGLVLLLNDLTRRKEQEAEQARKERLAIIGELSGNLAHEIRNSLKPVVGSIELLAGEIPRAGVAGELIEIILNEAETLEAFLDDFLSFSRDKTLTIEEVDLDTVIRAEIAAVSRHPACAPGVVINHAGSSVPCMALLDREALRAVLRNLLVNALEATQTGCVTIAREEVEDGARILVDDTGVGLPAVDPESLFEPFCTHKPGGTGLGLSIARRLARRLGGDVTLESRTEGGVRAVLRVEGCRVQRRAA